MDIEKLSKSLIESEGLRLQIYKDSLGYDTIGVGHKITGPEERNKYKNGITKEEALQLLKKDIQSIIPSLNQFPFFPLLNNVRQRVIAEMVFNMGFKGVSNFKKMCAYINKGDYVSAAIEMLDSLWAHQVKGRAFRLAKMMAKGEDL